MISTVRVYETPSSMCWQVCHHKTLQQLFHVSCLKSLKGHFFIQLSMASSYKHGSEEVRSNLSKNDTLLIKSPQVDNQETLDLHIGLD